MKRSIFLISLVLLLTLVATSSASAATWTEIQEVDVGISNPSWVQIQRVDVVVYPAQWVHIQTVDVEITQAEWVLVQTVDVEITQAEWVLIQTVEVSVTISSGPLVWTGLGVDNLASNPLNWNQGIAPFNGADIIFNSTSVKPCIWDIDASLIAVNSFTLANGYTGTLTQGDVDMAIEVGGYHQNAGVFNFNKDKSVFCNGYFCQDGGSIKSESLKLVMTGNQTIIRIIGNNALHSLRISGDVLWDCNSRIRMLGDGFVVDEGCRITIKKGRDLNLRYIHDSIYLNNGVIDGEGRLTFLCYDVQNKDKIKFGDVRNLVIVNYPSLKRDNKLTLDDSVNVSSLIIKSDYGNSIMLDLNGYSLTASSVKVGTNGKILWGEGIHRIGSLDTSAGSSDFETSQIIMTGGGTIKLGYGQQVNDLTFVSGTRTTLLSDLNVKGNFIGIKDLVLNNYRLILSGTSKVGPYPSNFNVSEPVFIPIFSPIQDGLQVYGDIPRWLRYDPIKGGLYGIPTKLGMNEFNITIYSPYVSLLTQRISFAVVDVPIVEHASKGQSVGNIISIVLTMVIVGICGITRRSSGGFDYDVSNALLGAAVGISVLVFTSVIPSYGLVLVALIFVAMYWGGR